MDTPGAVISSTGNLTFCPGNVLLLNANTGVGYTYKWYKNSSLIGSATGSFLNVSDSGNYFVRVTSPNLCSSGSSIVHASLYAKPSISSIAGPVAVQLPLGQVNYSVVNVPSVAYNWVVQKGSIMSGQSTNNVAVSWNNSGAGLIRVIVSNTDNCKDSASSVVNIAYVGLDQISGNPLLVYPNPFSGDRFTLQIQESINSLEIINSNGQCITGFVLSGAEVRFKNNLIPGIYYLRINAGGKYYIQKISCR